MHTAVPEPHSSPAVTPAVTVRSILHLDEIRGARPQVLSGSDRLDRPVRWVHIAETEEVPSLLEGGELILSSGTMFRQSPVRTRDFLTRLDQAGAAGFVIEIVDEAGRPSTIDRDVLTEAVRGLDFPVIVLAARARYVRVTQAAHRLLIGEQLARVERARRVHDVFTDLSLRSADEQLIVDTTAELLGSAVVLEDAAHRVLAFNSAASSPGELLDKWPLPSRQQVTVGVRGRRWGRLVAPFAAADDDHAGEVLERAGQAVTLVRMATQNERDLLQHAADALIHELMGSSDMAEEEARLRARSLGLGPARAYVPIAVRISAPEAVEEGITSLQLREQAVRTELVAAAKHAGATVISGGRRSGMIVGVVGCSGRRVEDTLTALFQRLGEESGERHSAGAGAEADTLLEAGRDLEHAVQVADIVATMSVRDRPFYRFADVRLRGLVSALRDDPRLRAFAESELGTLTDEGASDDLEFLELFLREGGNKSAIAHALGLSRPSVYARVKRVESALGVSLEDAESRTSLHTAVLWFRAQE